MPLFTNTLTGNEGCGEDGGEGRGEKSGRDSAVAARQDRGRIRLPTTGTTRACESPRRKGGMK